MGLLRCWVLTALVAGTGCRQVLGLDDVDCTPTFAAPVEYATASGPRAVAVADFDWDGTPDAVTANMGGNSLSRFLGKGDGTVMAKNDFPTVSQPVDLGAGDISGDGRSDLAVLSNAATAVVVMQSVGSDGFMMMGSYMLTAGRDLDVGDFDGNGLSDVAVVSTPQSGGEVSVMLAQADGTLAASVNYPARGNALFVRAADFTRDGVLDLLVIGRLDNDAASVYPGNGDGSFGTKIDTPMAPPVSAIAVGDVNGDEIPDAIVAAVDLSGAQSSTLIGAADGTFAIGTAMTATSIPLALADLDRDDLLDLVSYDFGAEDQSRIAVQLGIGDGTFAMASTYPLSAQPLSATVANIDADSVPEVVVVLASDKIAILDGSCTFAD